jgi:hypothetical protein
MMLPPGAVRDFHRGHRVARQVPVKTMLRRMAPISLPA